MLIYKKVNDILLLTGCKPIVYLTSLIKSNGNYSKLSLYQYYCVTALLDFCKNNNSKHSDENIVRLNKGCVYRYHLNYPI